MTIPHIAVIGGGLGGLAAAFHLERKYGLACPVTLFEATGRLGGKILTGRFAAAPVEFEAGVAELYGYEQLGPDPLRALLDELGVRTRPFDGQSVVLGGRRLRTRADIRRQAGAATLAAIDAFHARVAAAIPRASWFEGTPADDNGHPWARRSFQSLLDEVPDPLAREYLRVACHSDVAAEPHQTNALNGAKNVLMDVPGYIRLYAVEGGNERLPQALAAALRTTRVVRDTPVARVAAAADGTFHLDVGPADARRAWDEPFDAVVVALPHAALGAVRWEGDALAPAMAAHIAYYDRPAHYVRVSALFTHPFWGDALDGDWVMLDAFGGCCLYIESGRRDAAGHGVLSWLIAGNDALALANERDATIVTRALASLPAPLVAPARATLLEAQVHRWLAAVSAQPGGRPVKRTRAAHVPAPAHPSFLVAGDYLFDSTLNGVVDSADFATDLLQGWLLRRDAEPRRGRTTPLAPAPSLASDGAELREWLRLVWHAAPPARVLDIGRENDRRVAELRAAGFDAAGFAREGAREGPHRLPFGDASFDFVHDTTLAELPERDAVRAIQELRRITGRGVLLSTLASDLAPGLLHEPGRLDGVRTLITLWEWSELFLANGFTLAVTDPRTLAALWRREERRAARGRPRYRDADSLRHCFYTPTPAA